MKLDCIPDNGAVRVHPHAALEQIREAVRPRVLRSQRRWKRKARLRHLALKVEMGLIVTCGVVGAALGAFFLAREAYYLVSYIVERVR